MYLGKYVSERGRDGQHSIKKQSSSAPTGEEDEDTSQDDREMSNAQPQSEIDTEESDQQSTETATEMTTQMNRKCKAGPKKFNIAMTRKQWNKIKPKHGKQKLRPPWTDTFYQEFLKKNPCCTLAFKYQHVKTKDSRKKEFAIFLCLCKMHI